MSAFPGSLSRAVPSSAAFFGYQFLRFGGFGDILLRRASSDFDGGSCLLSGLFFFFFLLFFAPPEISPLYLNIAVFSNALPPAIQALLLNKSSLELGVAALPFLFGDFRPGSPDLVRFFFRSCRGMGSSALRLLPLFGQLFHAISLPDV